MGTLDNNTTHSYGKSDGGTREPKKQDAKDTSSEGMPRGPHLLASTLRFGRELPEKIRSAARTNPIGVVAGVGGATFVLGSLFGSKVGRLVIGAVVAYGVNRLAEGPIGREIEQAAKDALNPDAKHA